MIRPRKYMRLSQCALRVAAVLLDELRSFFTLPLPEVEPLILGRLGDQARANIPPALNLLFLLGLVDYRESNDSLEYVPPRNRDSH